MSTLKDFGCKGKDFECHLMAKLSLKNTIHSAVYCIFAIKQQEILTRVSLFSSTLLIVEAVSSRNFLFNSSAHSVWFDENWIFFKLIDNLLDKTWNSDEVRIFSILSWPTLEDSRFLDKMTLNLFHHMTLMATLNQTFLEIII